jgi:hypothetical protein
MAATKSRADHQAGQPGPMTGQKDRPRQEENHQKVPTKQIGTSQKKRTLLNTQVREDHLQHHLKEGHLHPLPKGNLTRAAANIKAVLPAAKRKAIRHASLTAAGRQMAATVPNPIRSAVNRIAAG